MQNYEIVKYKKEKIGIETVNPVLNLQIYRGDFS
jgi:hypothetical protein